MFMRLLTGIINASNHKKCVLLSNQTCEIQSTPINLHPNEYSQELHYYSFTVKLDKCVGSCSTLNDLSNKVLVSNKTEDLNLSTPNVITGKDEPKILAKGLSCKFKCGFERKNVIQINGGIKINVMSHTYVMYVINVYIFWIVPHVVVKMANI